MASQTQGIQQLLVAEKKAADKISDARKRCSVVFSLLLRKASSFLGKAKRLKQAKEEAQVEITKYRQERERQFKENEARVLGSRSDYQTQIQEQTKANVVEINKKVEQSKGPAIQKILQIAFDIQPEVHKNYASADI